MNETDRELLTWAAKAAGLPHKWIPMLGKMLHIIDGGNSDTWNPLDNDGDAFRLAVGLRLEIEFGSNFVNVGKSGSNKEWHLAREEFGDDPLAATRRAIVRAAAEIGMQMP